LSDDPSDTPVRWSKIRDAPCVEENLDRLGEIVEVLQRLGREGKPLFGHEQGPKALPQEDQLSTVSLAEGLGGGEEAMIPQPRPGRFDAAEPVPFGWELVVPGVHELLNGAQGRRGGRPATRLDAPTE